MNPFTQSDSSADTRWEKFSAAARRAAKHRPPGSSGLESAGSEGDFSAPLGFATRVVSRYFAGRREQVLRAWQRWSWRAAWAAVAAAVAVIFAVELGAPPARAASPLELNIPEFPVPNP